MLRYESVSDYYYLSTSSYLVRLSDKVFTKSEFGEVAIDYSMSGNVLVATQTVSFVESRISPGKYPGFRDFVNAYIRATRMRLRVVNANS